MNFLPTPSKYRMLIFLALGGILLLISCTSDPLVFNPPGGYTFEKNVFALDTSQSTTVQGEHHTGESPRVYTGILSNGDTVSTLLHILPEQLSNHPACTSQSVSSVKISLHSVSNLAIENNGEKNYLMQSDSLKVFFLPPSDSWDEQKVLSEADVDEKLFSFQEGIQIADTLITISNTSLEITLQGNQDSLFQSWCSESQTPALLISYLPDLEAIGTADNTFLEFASANMSNAAISPELKVSYLQNQSTQISKNRYFIQSVTRVVPESEGVDFENAFYISDSTSPHWGTVYALNMQTSQFSLSESVRFDSVAIGNDIIAGSYNQSLTLVKIRVEIDPQNSTDSDSVYFNIDSAIAFKSKFDPAGDNWHAESNPDSTENNLKYDDGELFDDDGSDGCKDSLEDGTGLCLENETDSPFNNLGTEGNGILDWTDRNGNDIWDEGEGEKWQDWGSDFCPDSLESGDGLCNGDGSLGYDPNKDNADPAGDDSSHVNPFGTEKNGRRNSCEPFKDWGIDGLPASLSGDPDTGESNGKYDEGESFEDTGLDGKFNEDEVEDYSGRIEGNGIFDEGEFLDCGEDAMCDDNDISDDYNIDPNNDNWNASDTTGTEGNGILDGNNYWGETEGERWYDFGVDRVPDSLEAFQITRLITPYLPGSNGYLLNLQGEETTEFSFEVPPDTISIWISEIKKTGENQYEVFVNTQTHLPLMGMQFKLSHIPFTQTDTVLKDLSVSTSTMNGENLFSDFTLLPRNEMGESVLTERLMLNYADNLNPRLDFESLHSFLQSGDFIFSHQYSNLILYLDKSNTSLHSNGMWLYVGAENKIGEEVKMVSTIIPNGADSISVPIGAVLKGIQNGTLAENTPLYLFTNGSLYNYSTISFLMNADIDKFNPRIEVMYSQ